MDATQFLAGQEYVVDCVSHEGSHKVVAFWVYDKRQTEGCDFAYYGLRLFESADGVRERGLFYHVYFLVRPTYADDEA